MKKILGNRLIQVFTMTIIVMSALLIMYPPEIEFFQKTSEYAVHLMFGFLVVGFLFLALKQRRLMFISMMASAFLAFFLKMASNPDMMLLASNAQTSIKIVHFNLASMDQEMDFQAFINNLNPDIISFQEYTPSWDKHLPKYLYKSFPFVFKLVRSDRQGMALYSRVQTKESKTLDINGMPNISVELGEKYDNIHLIGSYINPDLNKDMNTSHQLKQVAEHIRNLDQPVITLGDFNSVYWAQEIINFRDQAGLTNSRRNISLSSLKMPHDHIFYSENLECIAFEEVMDENQNHLGVTGTYQLKKNALDLSGVTIQQISSITN